MKKVFEGEIISVLPVESGLVIAYVLEKQETTLTVAYKMVSFETGKMVNVPRSSYEFAKFGSNYKAVSNNTQNRLLCKVISLPAGKTFLLEPTGEARLVDSAGNVVWIGGIEYQGAAPASIAVSERAMWACFSERNVLMRLNLTTMREELRIGGGKASPFCGPVDLYIEGNTVFVSNQKGCNILKVDLNTYAVEEYRKFEEPVLSFIKHGKYEFAVLKSGLYLIN